MVRDVVNISTWLATSLYGRNVKYFLKMLCFMYAICLMCKKTFNENLRATARENIVQSKNILCLKNGFQQN